MHDSFQVSLFEQFKGEMTIITPNRRLSATLHKLYQQYQLSQQQYTWITPEILPLITWLQKTWHDDIFKNAIDVPVPLLLNPIQENFLWEQVVSTNKNHLQLLQVSETAELIKSAWSTLKQWLVNLEDPAFKENEDYRALYTWANAFQHNNKKNNFIDQASLVDILIEKISSKKITPTKNIILVGFTELSPQLKKLITTYEASGTRCHTHSKVFSFPKKTNKARISLSDAETEILTMARWAKKIYDNNPLARIGCVVPSLEKIRDRILQIFKEIFQKDCFNISAGKSLIQCPIILTALKILSLSKKTISLDTLNILLSSPFLVYAETERIKRANFESLLRKNNIANIRLPNTDLEKYCPLLGKKLKTFLLQLEQTSGERTYQEWSKVFSELLNIMGWPGERSLNSEEYQIVEHWLRLLEEFSSLDQIAKPTALQPALNLLKKLAAKSIFQPKTPDAPIQILGVLEAAGLPFDHLWLTGMDDLSWPAPAKPNPFIPKRLQRELNMPHATAERELIYCQQLINQFQQNSQEIIFSYAKNKDEIELNVSPLIREINEISTDELNLDPYISSIEQVYLSKQLEVITDEIAPVTAEASENIKGGVNIIKQQALCPFKAFAEMRLHAYELEDITPGLRAKDRGSILHKALELLWNKLADHATLCQQDDNTLLNIINLCVDETLGLFPHCYTEKPKYVFLEKKRLVKILWDWLQIEKQRTPFKVLNNEKSTQLILNRLTLTVRIDRIDELEDGKKLIIDYKTGKNNEINSWFGHRPDEPQLPLYSLLDIDNTVGITFAQISPGKNCFKGISRYALNIQGIKTTQEYKKLAITSWEEQLNNWKSILTKLGEDFYSGLAKVDPKDPETCTHCALKPLCRINEEMSEHVN